MKQMWNLTTFCSCYHQRTLHGGAMYSKIDFRVNNGTKIQNNKRYKIKDMDPTIVEQWTKTKKLFEIQLKMCKCERHLNFVVLDACGPKGYMFNFTLENKEK